MQAQHSAAVIVDRLYPVPGGYKNAEPPGGECQAAPWANLRDLPDGGRQLGLEDYEPAAGGQRSRIQPPNGPDRGCPLGPSLDIAHHFPDPCR